MGTINRRQRAIARTRDDIVEAAARAIERSGYKSVTMQQIAREAGYTAASLYTYFKSKEDIFEYLIELRSAEFRRMLDAPMPEGLTFEQRIELMVRRQLEMLEQRRELLVGFMSGQTERSGDARRGLARCLHEHLEERVQVQSEWFRRHASPRDIGGRDPVLAARFMVGFAFALVHDWALRERKGSLVERAPLIVDFFLYGVRGDPENPAKGKT